LSLINRGITKDHALLLLDIHKLEPQNVQYKADAALAYFVLLDSTKAEHYANEILKENEYNTIAWAILVFQAGAGFSKKLKEVPNIIRTHNEFVGLLFNWLLYHQLIRTVHEFNQAG